MSDLQNARKPEGAAGEAILERMNESHAPLSEWGLQLLGMYGGASVLDIGCGGGANVHRLLAKTGPGGKVWGVDYSDVSVRKSKELNADAIRKGQCGIIQADVRNLPFPDATFDFVTAFETIYFWPDLEESLDEVWRVLKMGGTFLVCNESSGISERDAQLEEEIEGMRIYTRDELLEKLEGAGMDVRETAQTPDGWLCMVATKYQG